MHKIKRDESSKYYLYRHLYKDTKIPFYIGIGTKRKLHSSTFESEYERAHNFTKRSQFWINCYKKHGVVIEILYECNTRKEIINKEIEFIELYKRRDLGGILVNLTDGGELPINLNPELEKERRRKISIALKNRERKQSTYDKISKSKMKKIYKCDLNFEILETFNSISEAANSINLTSSSISKCLKNDKYTAGGYKWKLV